ncbi:flagellar biosynthetic protein FliR [Natronocella acetinitrilica]|jgi:flagellar biosynthesis protein FliR|uniref:Flagellar biosynthetic protein FliR n=1 Tax=Natronocella acetinitrilica TaxID=414046 RepID=A0AAE3KGT6_9GAMM|nr:flagellar biosynthetic protein FliR [Natronocella acetinitrilica]MCP1675592.1 flagellar biosynthetic protein FliR [Natronocella acetinitrilica]
MLTLSTAELMAWIGAFMWPFIRVGAMLFAAPVFGNTQVPLRIRLMISLALTVAIMPAVGEAPAVEPLSVEALLIAIQQVIIGLAMGLMLALAFQTAVIAGESIALTMGLGFATMVDPTSGQTVPVVSQFLQVVITLLFLAVGGHLMFIEMVAASFSTLTLTGPGLVQQDLTLVFGWATQMYAGAVLIALPAIVLLLTVNIALGVMTRAAPQMNIFSVGFPVTMMVGFLLITILIIPSLPRRMSAIWSDAFNTLGRLIGVN